jgi:hypothetical protein
MLHAFAIVLLTAGALLSAQTQNGHAEAIPTLTVCEALSHASEYDGKIVRIRDQVVATDEGASFLGENCPGVFLTDGKVWPSAIAWTSPTELMFILHPVDFSFDRASRKRLDKKWGQLRKRLPDKCIAVTYTGMFESWSQEKAKKRDPKGRLYEIPGFGHLNEKGAQLVVKSADDVAPIPHCGGKK